MERDNDYSYGYCIYCGYLIHNNGIYVIYKNMMYHKDCFDLMFPEMKEEEIHLTDLTRR